MKRLRLVPGTLARNVGGGDDVNLMAQVIESQHAIEEHQHTIGQGKIVLGVLADSFQLANRVVGDVANGTGGETWQFRERRWMMLPEQLFQDWQHGTLALFARLTTFQQEILPTGPHLQVRTRPEERVAADLLAALDGFEQKSVRLIGGDGEKGRDWCQQVGRDRLNHRDQRELARQARKLLVIGA
jgi:hypothetical protein